MAYKDITAGTKSPAKIKKGRFIQSKGGTTAIEIAIEFDEPSSGTKEILTWQGWLSEKAMPYTMEALVKTMGYNGSTEIDDQGVLTDPNAFDVTKELSIVVKLEPTMDENGQQKYDDKGNAKFYPKIEYINKVGGSAYAGLKPQELKSALAVSGFKAAFLNAKQSAGTPVVKAAPTNASAPVVNMAPMPTSKDSPAFDSGEPLPW